MDDDIAIKIENVSKKFSRSLKRSMLYGVKDIGRNALGIGSNPDTLRKSEFWAVDDVSFEVKKGEVIGLIGPNGSGKTTLLKMLNGIFWPDKGEIAVNGRVGALIAVGAGFHPMLTGRENIFINAAIMGMTKEEVDEKFDDIVEFADIGDFLDTPVKFYSSGMFVRLGFAVAVHCVPDVLLVDEVLAVGDIEFQRKAFQKIHEIVKSNKTVIFVTHNIPAVLSLTQKAIYINNGRVQMVGETPEVVEKYTADMNNKLNIAKSDNLIMRRGTGEVRFTSVEVFNDAGEPCTKFHCNDTIIIKASFKSKVEVTKPNFAVGIREVNSRTLVTIARSNVSNLPDLLPSEGVMVCEFKDIPLRPNKYNLYLLIGDLNSRPLQFDIWDEITPKFSVMPTKVDYEEGYFDRQEDLVKLPYDFRIVETQNLKSKI